VNPLLRASSGRMAYVTHESPHYPRYWSGPGSSNRVTGRAGPCNPRHRASRPNSIPKTPANEDWPRFPLLHQREPQPNYGLSGWEGGERPLEAGGGGGAAAN
jgi:hypothetical protein